ncbi:hypothetical protein Rhopal_003623-T1 [Rhodotorula paludigena]|uniref:3-hydroxyisobutyrate dehydrogenase n=1 Tax=Rhodotorula paludigena TaxID=86838 RepID=A0AAV5GM62_9BASI|nr:hypothetical protein Rhopal_003623-T1 [Rhodotorula paludigena]
MSGAALSDRDPPTKEIRTLGYIGLGNAGYFLAKHLATHLSAPAPLSRILVRDLSSEREAQFVREVNALEGVHAAAEKGTRDNWGECDVVVTMLPHGDAVREVLLGKEGIAPLLKPGTVLIDTSSADPFNTVKMEEELRSQYGLYLVDSAVTQERDRAIGDGEVTYLVGGQDEAVEAAMPVLKCTSKYVFRMGGPGKGHIAKTLNNYVSAAAICALLDAYVLGAKAGVDPLTLTHAFNVGTAQSFSSRYSMTRDGLSGSHDSGYNLALLVKDLRINERVFDALLGGGGSGGGEEGAQDGYPAHVRRRFERALEALGGDAGACHTRALRAWEKEAGVEVPKYEDVWAGKLGD